ncbi:hypothetical protein FB451DRAFT_1566567 [Mycena latifolia]|nr:hypothetical protein FB451DRAFT_1566567 [Mycena latifolia]
MEDVGETVEKANVWEAGAGRGTDVHDGTVVDNAEHDSGAQTDSLVLNPIHSARNGTSIDAGLLDELVYVKDANSSTPGAALMTPVYSIPHGTTMEAGALQETVQVPEGLSMTLFADSIHSAPDETGVDARLLDDRVLEKRRKIFGEDHPLTLSAMANLGTTYGKLGQYKKAEELEVAGQLKEAEELEVAVLEKQRKSLGEDHPDTLSTMAKLGSTYGKLGQFKEAEELEVVVLKKRGEILGEDHLLTLSAMAKLGSIYGKLGQFKEAEELEVVVLEKRRKILGEDHPDTLSAMVNLGSTYGKLGRFKEAEELEVVVLKKRRKVLREDHPDILHTLLGTENPDSQDNREIPTLESMHIASAFLITETDDMQLEARTAHSGLRLNDFNGRQVYVPLVLCKSWTDLCSFLAIFLEGNEESRIITRGNFGLRDLNEVNLLSSETWDPWMKRFNENAENTPATLELYAILEDDTDSCPHCKKQNPVKNPLPGNLQQCAQCNSTFLEVYRREPEVSLATPPLTISPPLPETTDISDTPLPQAPDNSGSDGNAIVPSTRRSPIASDGTIELEQPINIPICGSALEPILSYPLVSPAIRASGLSVPKHVQVIRRRKPFQNDVVDKPTRLITTADSVTTATHTPPNYYLEVFHKLYMWVLLGLPDHYSRDAPQPLVLGGYDDGATQALYRRREIEWIVIGVAAFLLILFIPQRCSASYDLLPRVMLFLSAVFLFFTVIYAIILSRTFGKLKVNTEGLDWIRQVSRPPKNCFWNPWIMVSMPAVCIFWGGAFFILSFIWRGDPHGKDQDSDTSPKQEYGPPIAATFLFALGFIYLRLMIRDVKRMGSDSAAQPSVPDTLLREVSNVVLHDVPELLGRAGQIVIGQIINISGGVGGTSGGTGYGTQVEIHPVRNIHGVGSPCGNGDERHAMPGGYIRSISGGTGGPGGGERSPLYSASRRLSLRRIPRRLPACILDTRRGRDAGKTRKEGEDTDDMRGGWSASTRLPLVLLVIPQLRRVPIVAVRTVCIGCARLSPAPAVHLVIDS